MGRDAIIRVEGLGKKYVIGHESRRERDSTLRDAVIRMSKGFARTLKETAGGRPLVAGDTTEEFWALKDVSFEVKRGEVLGIIGRNGAGKSTLLKILSRITDPSEGRATVRGRVSSLLEVGTGFHPELTGRENIFLNGAILGMTRAEIRRKFDEMVEFAGIEKFLDTAVKRYSSGMYVRLAFAVAAHLEPEVLIIDEVLAVGDVEFQKKCLGKMHDVAQAGRTVLVVSHDMAMILSLCSRAIVLSRGELVSNGEVKESIQFYLDKQKSISAISLKERNDRQGDGRLRFIDAYVEGSAGNVLRMGEDARIVLIYSAASAIKTFDISIHIENSWGQTILRLATRETAAPVETESGKGVVTCEIPRLRLLPGKYTLLVAASVPPGFDYLDYVSNAGQFDVVEDDVYATGKVPEFGCFFTECKWRHESGAA